MPNPLSDVATWAYAIQDVGPGRMRKIGALPVDLVVVDQADRDGVAFDAADIATLRGANDKLVVSYLSIGEAETYRDYWDPAWQETPPDWLGAENPEWEGNIKVAYWDPAWQEIVFGMVDALVDAGFDGLYLDIVDAFWYWEERDPDAAAGLYRDRMVDFVAAIRARAEARLADNGTPGAAFAIIGQNAEELAEDPDYLAAIDGIGKEDLYFHYPNGQEDRFDTVPNGWLTGAQALLATAEAAGVETFVVEYVPDAFRDQVIAEIRAEIAWLGSLPAPLYLSSDRDLVGIDTIIDIDGRVRLWGDDDGERLPGTPWRDLVRGGAGDDTLRGKAGRDKLLGEQGADILHGNRGNDTLDGGAGRDVATGGGGDDRFVFRPGDEFLKITDFGVGADTVDLRGFSLDGVEALRAAARDQGNRVVIDLGDDRLVLKGLSLSDLDGDGFLL